MKKSGSVVHTVVWLALFMGGRPVLAQETGNAPSLPMQGAPDVEEPPTPMEDLQQQVEDLRKEIARKEIEQRANASRLSINGYVDFGFFLPLGNNGVGVVRDFGNIQTPQYRPGGMTRDAAGVFTPNKRTFAWTFLGDILATSVNTRGEPADLGDLVGSNRFDSIHSGGAMGFIANEVNLRVGYQLAERALLRTSLNFVPRSGIQDFSYGDSVDVDVAEMEYVLTDDGNTSLFFGKTLPVFGIEYKERKSDQRFGITPSLIHRYTTGPQLGLKFRSKLFAEWVILAGAVSNNSSVTEPFHCYSEIDRNDGKTLSGRAALSIPTGKLWSYFEGDHLEIGASGLWGAQDRAKGTAGKTHFIGLDLQYLSSNFALKGQIMRGKSDGLAAERVWELDLSESGYIEADWQIWSYLGVLGRFGVRDALVSLTDERIYVTKSKQLTGGLRIVFNPHVMLKAEYVRNIEYGMRGIKNDIATSSLVMHF